MTITQATLPCDIVLLPSNDQAEHAIHCSQLLAPQGSLNTLDGKNIYPRASLYMFQMALGNQATCVEALRRLAQQLEHIQLPQTGYFYIDSGFGKGYIDISFALTSQVEQLQQTTLDAFNPLRAGMRESDKAKMTDATGIKLANLQTYGYPAVGELFRPHITLTRFPMDTEPDLSVLPNSATFTGNFDRIGLFEMGTNGTCVREIASFDLRAS